jgi:hypothetical protein
LRGVEGERGAFGRSRSLEGAPSGDDARWSRFEAEEQEAEQEAAVLMAVAVGGGLGGKNGVL